MTIIIHSDDCIQHPKWKSAMTFWGMTFSRMTFKRTPCNIQNEMVPLYFEEWHSEEQHSTSRMKEHNYILKNDIQQNDIQHSFWWLHSTSKMKECHDILKNDIQQNDIQRNNTQHPKWKSTITKWRVTLSRTTFSINSDDSMIPFNIQSERAPRHFEEWH